MVLNPTLHERLEEQFGRVTVANKGQTAQWKAEETDSGLWGRKVGSGGEEYRVDCPFCTDSRARLYISYLYGSTVEDDDGRHVRFGGGLAHCFNETHCMGEKANREELWRVLIRGQTPILFDAEGQDDEISQTPVYPEDMQFLHKLPDNHVARRYVEGRDFDPDALGRLGLAYVRSDPRDAMVQGTIFIPLLDVDRNLVGGQCRRLTSPHQDWPPKYYTLKHSPCRSVLFNGWRAKGQDLVVVTEGPFDALRVGECGVATLGGQVSRQQRQLLARYWDRIVLAFDADMDAGHSIDRLKRTLDSPAHHKEVYELDLPAGKDPAAHTHHDIWDTINEELEREGTSP